MPKGKQFFGILIGAVLLLSGFVISSTLNNDVCANTKSCKDSLVFNVDNNEKAIFNNQEFAAPKIDLAQKQPKTKVLGESNVEGEKHIYVDLSTQTLKAYQGETLFMEAAVSTGKWFPTPTGEFTIWQTVRSTKMSGGEGADYYYLPNVPFVMFFSNDKVAAGRGFGLHGAYWHNNFGHPMSHGCVNMRSVDAEKLYYWVSPTPKANTTPATSDDPGTKITIYGQAPL